MAKKTKITAANIMKAMDMPKQNKITLTCGEGDDAIEISVKARLTLEERLNMIGDILSMVFIASDEGEEYRPELKRLAFDYAIVNYFTDIALPVDSAKAWEFLTNTQIALRITESAIASGSTEITDILTDANEAIAYRKGVLMKASKFDTLMNSIIDVVNAIRNVTNDMDLQQLMQYVQENAPELKDQFDALIANDITNQ